MSLACMLCGAGGGRELFITLLVIWVLMFVGTFLVLACSIYSGDFRDTRTRARPIEAEAEGGMLAPQEEESRA